MSFIETYLFRQVRTPVLAALLALGLIALLSQSLSALDVVVERGQSAFVLAEIALLALPQVLSIIMPVAVFVGGLWGLNRLHTEQEIVVCFAAGVSRWRATQPMLRLAAITAVACLASNLWLQPLCYRHMRQELYRIRTDLASTLVREGEFVEAGGGMTVYAQKVEQSGRMKNLFVHIKKKDGSTAYTAQEGRITRIDDRPVLLMRAGSMQEFSPKGVLNFLAFDDYGFDLSPYVSKQDPLRYKASDRWLHELFFPDLTQAWDAKNRRNLLAEGHSRLASPLYCVTFMMLALAGVIGGSFSRIGYGRAIVRVAAIAAGLRILGFVVQAASASNAWANIGQYLVPIVATILTARYLYRPQIAKVRPDPALSLAPVAVR